MLTPALIAKDLEVSDYDKAIFYEMHASIFWILRFIKYFNDLKAKMFFLVQNVIFSRV